jgi:anti-anti-sigma factor
MLTIRVEQMADMAVIECKGRVVQSDAVFKLRDAVMAQTAPIIILDMSEVQSIGGGGVGMLAVLERWAQAYRVHLKLYSPSKAVVRALEQHRLMPEMEIASFHEMVNLLMHSDGGHQLAA